MNKSLTLLSVLAVLLVLVITGCEQTTKAPPNVTLEGAIITSSNTTLTLNNSQLSNISNITNNASVSLSDNVANVTNTTTQTTYTNVSYTLTATEGDLVALKLKAVDPNGLPLKYTYSTPFNSQGLWQTKDGDAGKYLVSVTASNGFANATADILVTIKPSNKPPVVDCPTTIRIKEGDTVNIKCDFYDPQNYPLIVDYSGWMTSSTYTTNFESAGTHPVFVTASDGYHNTTYTVTVIVEKVDRAPVFNSHFQDMTITEGDVVTLNPNVTDPDNNPVTITFSTPFNSHGIWRTQVGNAGVYPISIVASDGTLNTKETFTLNVKMLETPPVMAPIANITVHEGDAIIFNPLVTDRQGNPITITYSGWMNSATYNTTYSDAYPSGCNYAGCNATYKVTVTASDGFMNASQDVYVTVIDTVRSPVFVLPSS